MGATHRPRATGVRAQRYSDLKRGLPGIATNLLAERLKTMEADGLIERFEAPGRRWQPTCTN